MVEQKIIYGEEQEREMKLAAEQGRQPICVYCVPGDTLILGDNKPIAALEVGERTVGIAGLNMVARTFKRPFGSHMVKIRASGLLPFTTTPEHPVLVASTHHTTRHRYPNRNVVDKIPYWKEASRLRPKRQAEDGDYLVIPRVKGTFKMSEIDLSRFTTRQGKRVSAGMRVPTSFPLNLDTAWLLGLYVAEGNSNPGERIIFSLNKRTETHLASRVIRITEKMGYRAKSYVHPTALHVNVPSRLLSRAFKDWCGNGASNKRIPDFILFHMDETILENFLDGYMAGDGSIEEGNRRKTANTVSHLLALQLQLAYARLGQFMTVFRYETDGPSIIQGRPVDTRDKYRLGYPDHERTRGRVIVFPDYILSPVVQIESVPHTGDVFNIETTDNTYTVSNAVIHNCGHPLNKVRQYQDTVIIWTYNLEKKEYEKDDSGGSADKASHECDQCNCEVKDWDFVDENLISF